MNNCWIDDDRILFINYRACFYACSNTSKVDEIDGNFGGWFGQIPPIIYIFLIIPLLIGVALLKTKDSDI
jgi:hypothetical protein